MHAVVWCGQAGDGSCLGEGATALEGLLPQVAYGSLCAEDTSSLTIRHLQQLLRLGQACLDYLWATCLATSRAVVCEPGNVSCIHAEHIHIPVDDVLTTGQLIIDCTKCECVCKECLMSTLQEQQVQQLATASAHIPELTSATEELRDALAGELGSNMTLAAACIAPAAASGSAPLTTSHGRCVKQWQRCVADGSCGGGGAAAADSSGFCQTKGKSQQSCGGRFESTAAPPAPALLAGSGLASMLPAADGLRDRMNTLEWDLRCARALCRSAYPQSKCTDGIRRHATQWCIRRRGYKYHCFVYTLHAGRSAIGQRQCD